MLQTNINALGLVVSETIFKVFTLKIYFQPVWPRYEMDLNLLDNFKEGHIRIIPAKFGQNSASSLGGDVIWSNCWRRTTTHNGHPTITIANHEPMAQVS